MERSATTSLVIANDGKIWEGPKEEVVRAAGALGCLLSSLHFQYILKYVYIFTL